jgi:hypothetical protein
MSRVAFLNSFVSTVVVPNFVFAVFPAGKNAVVIGTPVNL